MQSKYFSKDILEFILLLAKYKVRYLIVGGEAVIYYGHARLTGDIDFFYESTLANAKRLYKALLEFWNSKIPGEISIKDFLKSGSIIQFGVPPNRIDLINKITAVNFQEAWKNKQVENIHISGLSCSIFYIGLRELIKNKKAVKRYKDLDDLQYLMSIK